MDSSVIRTLDKLQREVINDLLNEAAIATIISTLGSTPQKVGAQMIIFRDGRTVGTIGGGCGEAEVQQKAFHVLKHGRPIVIEVNLTHETAENEGMACGGFMQVYIEPALYCPRGSEANEL